MRLMVTKHFCILLLLYGFFGIEIHGQLHASFDTAHSGSVFNIGSEPVGSINLYSSVSNTEDFMFGPSSKWFNTPPAQLTAAQLAYFYSFGGYKTHRINGSDSNHARRKRSLHFYPMKYRKEIRHLSSSERTKFYNAVNAMKTTMIDGMSQYDIFVAFHNGRIAKSAHNGAGFLPWHREYLWRFERALQAIDSSVALPYWDSSLDYWIPNPKDSMLWTEDLLGNNDGRVTTGPFKNWQTMGKAGCNGPLTRDAQSSISAKRNLFNDDKIMAVTNKKKFLSISTQIDGLDTPNDNFRGSQFEYDHGGPHGFVGGHMGDILCSPSDPVFWLHHAFIDFIWLAFRRNQENREIEYPTTDDYWNIGGPHHEAFAPMAPFDGLVNIHGLSDHYRNYYYRYDESAIVCDNDDECGSEFLWCDSDNHHRCKAKIKPGGDCTGFNGQYSPCYGPDYCCYRGKCIDELPWLVRVWRRWFG